MEMMVPQVASTQPQALANANTQAGKSAGGDVFQKTLVQQINGETASNSGIAQTAPLVAVVNKEAAIEGGAAEIAPTLSDLMSIIDGLLEQLEAPTSNETETPAEDSEQLQQLADVLDQMNALLALLGLPVPVIQQSNKQSSLEDGTLTVPQAITVAANIKSKLQDTLIQVQVMLQQGTSKLIHQQEPSALVAQQLHTLTAILEGETVDTTKSQTKSTAFTQQLFTVQQAPQAEVGTLLQRLSQQTVHPAFLSTTAANSMEQTVESEAAVSSLEISPQLQIGSNPETTRGITPLVVNATAMTSFVAADEFAQSMTGMIIQKFDLTTVNGVSEAKIMLFPEHLGQVDVRITMQNGLLTAIFQTDNVMAKDMLDNQMAQLRSALQAQGLMVDKLEVSQGQSTSQLSQQHQGQGSSQQQGSNRQVFNIEESSNDGIFEAEMIEQVTIQGLGFGRGINVKA
ncbi:flagellar hook-length control protein FliK [Paenibacillus sp. LHD-38]|uniref:flagellar hook-length control protein FliK n=1 Tax=Paenibacillus sp. LHD-38 TaxID=3072143 RepID=UPI00280E6F5F|nr:flagellar hook-length control protein FliK [Paenibacillus sp. LHD-38]MDQ8733357.1 flagellar hook-length control protein FliK [Paenibacillus sp. LHD-38]